MNTEDKIISSSQLKVSIIYLGNFSIHDSVKQLFSEHTVYKCTRDYQKIINLYNEIKSTYDIIFITDDFVFTDNIYKMSYYSLDYIGGDYYCEAYKNVKELFELTKSDVNAKAFNTKGYIKNFIDKDRLDFNSFLEGGGIYIYEDKISQKNVRGLYICQHLLELIPKLDIKNNFFYVIYSVNHKTHLIDTGKYKYIIYPNDYIGSCLYDYGYFSPCEIFFLGDLIKENWNIIEIGANIGSHTVPLSKINNKGKYFAFEPQHDIFKLLVSNCTLNSCDNVIPYNYGISDKNEIIYYKANVNNINRGSFAIPLSDSTYNDFLKTKQITEFPEIFQYRIDLIKIDVEGMETIVLKSLENLITKDLPVIFIEYNMQTFKNLCESLKDLEYTLYYFNTSLKQYGKHEQICDTNIVAFPSSGGVNNILNYPKAFKLKQIENYNDPDYNILVNY